MVKLIMILSFSVFFTACQTFNGLTVINQISSPVVVVFQSHHANDTTNYIVLANESKTIKTTVFEKSIRDFTSCLEKEIREVRLTAYIPRLNHLIESLLAGTRVYEAKLQTMKKANHFSYL